MTYPWFWHPQRKTPTQVEVSVPAHPVRLRATLDFRATITITEDMMGALDALVGYGDDAFLKAFEDRLGKAYMSPHTKGLKLFFAAIREEVLPALGDVTQTRRDIQEMARRRQEARMLAQVATK